jgi:hypothetical protein
LPVGGIVGGAVGGAVAITAIFAFAWVMVSRSRNREFRGNQAVEVPVETGYNYQGDPIVEGEPKSHGLSYPDSALSGNLGRGY